MDEDYLAVMQSEAGIVSKRRNEAKQRGLLMYGLVVTRVSLGTTTVSKRLNAHVAKCVPD
jgi:hypothetical protein